MKCVGNDRDFCEICHGMTAGFPLNVSGSRSFHEMCKQRRCFREMCQQWPMFSRNMSAVTEVITKCASNGFGFHEVYQQWQGFNKMQWQMTGFTKCVCHRVSAMFKDFMKCVSNMPRISRNVSAKARNLGNV